MMNDIFDDLNNTGEDDDLNLLDYEAEEQIVPPGGYYIIKPTNAGRFDPREGKPGAPWIAAEIVEVLELKEDLQEGEKPPKAGQQLRMIWNLDKAKPFTISQFRARMNESIGEENVVGNTLRNVEKFLELYEDKGIKVLFERNKGLYLRVKKFIPSTSEDLPF